ncbi:hypothetical protein MCEMSE6_02718 [Oxalobacteraceae bacterium]
MLFVIPPEGVYKFWDAKDQVRHIKPEKVMQNLVIQSTGAVAVNRKASTWTNR